MYVCRLTFFFETSFIKVLIWGVLIDESQRNKKSKLSIILTDSQIAQLVSISNKN